METTITLKVPIYSEEKGFTYQWEKGFEIETKVENRLIHVKANKEGLISLANHLLNLAQDQVPAGFHLHLDGYNALEEGSDELIIEKK